MCIYPSTPKKQPNAAQMLRSRGPLGRFVWAKHFACPFLVLFGCIGIIEDSLLFSAPVFKFGFSLCSLGGFPIACFFLSFAK